ncbi:uncharacterized protein [Malus domestica]|uniref:uncharacterized protein n=1 Tax=Malus domestica TaxID=3750 RepID=UPI0039756C57
MKNPHLSLGLIFKDGARFINVVVMHSMINRYGDVHFSQNEKFKVDASCKEGCPWFVKCGKMCNSNNMHIKKILDHHACGRLWMNRNMKQFWLTKHYLEKIQLNPTWHVESFMDTIKAEWKHGCSKMKAYRAMIAAIKIIEGKHVEQYTRLWDFAEEINKTNPGSTVKIKLDEGMFQMMYVCLGACKEGFKHGCRPLIGLDGCHLKSQHGGNCWLLWGYVTPHPVFKIFFVLIDEPNGPTPLFVSPIPFPSPFSILSFFPSSICLFLPIPYLSLSTTLSVPLRCNPPHTYTHSSSHPTGHDAPPITITRTSILSLTSQIYLWHYAQSLCKCFQ